MLLNKRLARARARELNIKQPRSQLFNETTKYFRSIDLFR